MSSDGAAYEKNGKLGPWWRNGTLIWGALWWRNGQLIDPSDDEIRALWWPDEEIGGPRSLILFKRFNTGLIHGALILHCSSYISKIVWGLPMFDFSIFCHLLRLTGIYWVGAPVRVFEKFRSLFSFRFLFFLFFFFSFHILHFLFLSLSLGGPISSGAPGHCPPMPPSRYATETKQS